MHSPPLTGHSPSQWKSRIMDSCLQTSPPDGPRGGSRSWTWPAELEPLPFQAALSIFIDGKAAPRPSRSSACLLNMRRAARCWMRSCLSLLLLMLPRRSARNINERRTPPRPRHLRSRRFQRGEAAESLMSFFIRVERRARKCLTPIWVRFRSPPTHHPETVVAAIGTLSTLCGRAGNGGGQPPPTVQPRWGELSTPAEPISPHFLIPPRPNQQRGAGQ